MEDRAYSRLGTFDMNMATLYGEGERAFRRLQEEIVRRIPTGRFLPEERRTEARTRTIERHHRCAWLMGS